MKKFPVILLLLITILVPAKAQDIKLVTGTVINKASGMPLDMRTSTVEIYSFTTVALAQDFKKDLLIQYDDPNHVTTVISYAEGSIDANAYYSVKVPESGAIIFKAGYEPENIVLVEVKGRLEINVEMTIANVLTAATKTEERLEVAAMDLASEIIGNTWISRAQLIIPANTARTDVRLIVQPTLIDGDTRDTMRFLTPFVVDGQEYSITQLRKMSFDMNHDKLYRYIDSERKLDSDKQLFNWCDTIYLDNPQKLHVIEAKCQFEDYTQVYKKLLIPLTTSRIRRPVCFLDYPMASFQLNDDDYKEVPHRSKHKSDGNISLTFKVGKPVLDPDNPENEIQMNELKDRLHEITTSEGSVLTSFRLETVTSPEGTRQYNERLSRDRLTYAMNEIMNSIPKHTRDRIYWPKQTRIAEWTEVADTIEKYGYPADAEKIREIVYNHPQYDKQSQLIQRMPSYVSVIKPLLPKIRKVYYTYEHEHFRISTPREIVASYRSGSELVGAYEYWVLFHELTEPAELEKVYKEALDYYRKTYGRTWAYPANALAKMYIDRRQIDTTLLHDLIDFRTPHCDVRKYNERHELIEIVNPAPIVANQLVMMLKSDNFPQASRLCKLLPDTEEFKGIKSYALCFGGYYKGGNTEAEREKARQVFDVVAASSPLNYVIMHLALNMKAHDEAAAAGLPAAAQYAKENGKEALYEYLCAVVAQREAAFSDDVFAFMGVVTHLTAAFKLDPSFIEIASTDGDIEIANYEDAKSEYESGTNEN